MKALHVIIEPGKEGFGIMFNTPGFEGVFSYGETIEEAKVNARVVLKELVDHYINKGQEIPTHLKEINPETVKLRFSYLLKYYFELFPYINMTKMARKVGLNPSLMRQYDKGLVYASEEQFLKVRDGLRSIGKELAVV